MPEEAILPLKAHLSGVGGAVGVRASPGCSGGGNGQESPLSA